MTDKRSAHALIDLLSSREERPEIRDAAARGLQEMTGITTFGRDAARWQQWWSQNQDKSEDAFSAELSAARAARYDRLALRAQRLSDEVQALLTEQYRAAPDARREEMLLRYLRSSAPEVRRTGAQIVQSDFNETRPITPAVKEQLRRMIGDSAPQVRLKVAEAIKVLNDPAAVEPLLAQIARETDPDAKAMQALALAQSRDLRAVGSLLEMLRDPSPSIARSAAVALRDLAAPMKKNDPALASRAATALNDRLRQTDADPAALDLRVSLIEAMAPLAEPELRPTYVDLLRPNEPVPVRVQALRALGELREPWVADTIITSDALSDDNKDVRLAAVEALGKNATAKDAEVIYERIKPVERDPAVQAAAWNALAALFHNDFDADTLNLWAQRFMDNPDRRLFILNELKAKLIKSVDTARGQAKNEILSNLAGVEQNIGDVRMSLGQFSQAATEYEEALGFYEAQNENRAVIDVVVGQLMDAYLKSKSYEKAIAFAAKCFTRNPGLQPTLGTKILTEINALRDSGDLQNALKLVQETEKMDPPLAPQYGDEVKKLQEQLRRDIAAREKDAATIDEPPSAHDDGKKLYSPLRGRQPIEAARLA
jgi:HEAT repeat protein